MPDATPTDRRARDRHADRPGHQVLFVVSECAPLVKTGGLGDVAGSLPAALGKLGCRTRVLLPAYRGVLDAVTEPEAVLSLDVLYGGPARLMAAAQAGLDLLLLDAPHLYDRPGGPYTGPDRGEWDDNDLRFAALAEVAALIGRGALADGWTPDVIHGHDWQAGLVPLALGRRTPRPATVHSIHNMAYQGCFPVGTVARCALPPDGFTPEGYEYWGQVSFLKAGLVYADALSTVSETYAHELRDPAFGLGLEGVVAARVADMEGIVNGIDTALWDPAADPAIRPFGAGDLAARRANRRALAEAFGIGAPDGPLFGVVSRLTHQKGFDLLLGALPRLLSEEGALVVLGTGDPAIEDALRAAAAAHPGRVGVAIAYDETTAHRIFAGADAILVPSRFEPCGLTQLYALRYGALPVVARTGGLADTVIDANAAARAAGVATGFKFDAGRQDALERAISHAAACFRDTALWQRMQRNAMAQPVGWDVSAGRYLALYDRLVGARATV